MPKQTPIDRVSLKKMLEDRYNEQHAGGAFDVKSTIQTEGGHMSLSLGGNSSIKSATITPAGFKVKQSSLITEFKDSALDSAAMNGHVSKKYKP